MTKILTLGDLHIQPDNLSEINVYLEQLEKYLKQNTFDLIIILGDTLHTHEIVYTQCLNKMLEYVKLCEKYATTYSLVGNHELINNQVYLTGNHPFMGFKKSHNIVDIPICIQVNNNSIILCPYVPDGRFIEALNQCTPEWKTVNCIIGHQLLDGAKMGAITAKNVEVWDLSYPMLVCGHIHDKQHPQKNLYYPGSAMQVAFGETEDHTISVINLHEGNISIDEVNIHPPKKKTIYADIKNIRELKLPDEEHLRLKISISGDADEFKTFKKSTDYKDLIKKGIKVVFKQKRTALPANLPKTSFRSFPDILYSIVSENPDMMDLYHKVLPDVFSSTSSVDIVFD